MTSRLFNPPGRAYAVLLITAFVMVGCGDAIVAETSDVGGSPIEVIVDGLSGPTQFVFDGDHIVVAQLNGGENDGTGQVVDIDPDGQSMVLFDDLDKPTGVAVLGDEIWIMERTRLSRGPRNGGVLTVVADELPNNGRSQGTLTVTPDNQILFNTSGSARAGVVKERSGRLWIVDETGAVDEYASGFKHAYAHVFDLDGNLLTTEVGDGIFDDQPPADEVVPVTRGIDHGWPNCVGDNRPVAEFGALNCQGFPASLAAFEPGATPVGIVVSPFDENRLLVSLWVTGEIVSVSRDGTGPIRTEFDGLSGPQHLVVRRGALYLSEFGADRIVKLNRMSVQRAFTVADADG